MHVLVIGGSTGREFAVLRHLKASPYCKCVSVYQWRDNPFARKLAHNYVVGDVRDLGAMIEFARSVKPDLAYIGQGESIEVGVTDALQKLSILTISPTQIFSRIESDKAFSKRILTESFPEIVPRYLEILSWDLNTVIDFLSEVGNRVVAKRDGKMNGRGVVVFDFLKTPIQDFILFCQDWLQQGGKIVLEEFIDGKEWSLTTYTDGVSFVHAPLAKNYKHLLDGDQGVQTSGMGTFMIHLAGYRLSLYVKGFSRCVNCLRCCVKRFLRGFSLSARAAERSRPGISHAILLSLPQFLS